ncbi:hypothetical protein PSAB6_100120 [Paraburkholderia sabiae]|nr:hypothetical protein PSAB6_100120 [Paraburkholderia sabiae]
MRFDSPHKSPTEHHFYLGTRAPSSPIVPLALRFHLRFLPSVAQFSSPRASARVCVRATRNPQPVVRTPTRRANPTSINHYISIRRQ